MSRDYYGEPGCCLTCEDPARREGWNGIHGDGCLCTDCKCKKCIHYRKTERGEGYCKIAANKKAKSRWGKKAVHSVDSVEKNTNKAVFAFVNINREVEGPIWIPKEAIENNKVQNWILEKKELVEFDVPIRS